MISHNIVFTHRSLPAARSARSKKQGSGVRRTHPHRLTAQAQPGLQPFSWWDVVNARTLYDIAENAVQIQKSSLLKFKLINK